MKQIDFIKSKRSFLTISTIMMCVMLMASTTFSLRNSDGVPYPEGHRDWVHVKTGFIEKGHPAYIHWGGFHHIYGNPKAIDGYKTGKFEDGSILVFDVLEGISKDSSVSEGKRKFLDVMVRDNQKYKSTGGWGFEEFQGDSKTTRNVGALSVTMCYNCHAQQKASDYVFSRLRN